MAKVRAPTYGAFALAGWITCQAAAEERDPAAAQALFDEARTLMRNDRYVEACPKLAESQRLDPGLGTLFRLADCREHEGKIASAWAAFLEVASLATASGQSDRAELANRRAHQLESRLPRLRILVPEQARFEGLQIWRDGARVGEAQWGVALPVDPGNHELRVSAPGRRPFLGALSSAEGATTSFRVPRLPVAADAPAPAGTQSADSTPAIRHPSSVPKSEAHQSSSERGGTRPGGAVIGLGAGGVVALGAGTAFGLVARSKYEDSKTLCNPDDVNRCSQGGIDLRDDAFLFGNLATASFVLGGAAIATAAVLWATGVGTQSAAARGGAPLRADVLAVPGRATLTLRGRF